MSARGAAFLCLAGFFASGACGPEDIELAASRPGPDAAAAEAGRFNDDATALDCDVRSPSMACRALDAACASDRDCCSVHCAAGTCAIPGTCVGAGAMCTSRAQCCSGRCEPTAGSTTLLCLAECAPANAPCTRASDCCALGCNAGVCKGAECLREGSDCTANAQCCSNECDLEDGGQGKCGLDAKATCRASGDDCSSGGSGHCCGVCDSAGRCDPGPGPCRPLGSVCSAPGDCCHGACTDDGTGRSLCTSAPLADGTPCVASFECTSLSCIGAPPVCGSSPPSCGMNGAPCTNAMQCCSALCTGGICQPSRCTVPP